MILDSSAVVAILQREHGYQDLLEKISEANIVGIGAPTLVETAMVLSAKWNRDARPRLIQFLREAEVEVIPFGADHMEAATDAFLRFGKGRHAAALNFGDCMSYATAAIAGMPLLFAGAGFSHTDIVSA